MRRVLDGTLPFATVLPRSHNASMKNALHTDKGCDSDHRLSPPLFQARTDPTGGEVTVNR